jgi:hypothetical protein
MDDNISYAERLKRWDAILDAKFPELREQEGSNPQQSRHR